MIENTDTERLHDFVLPYTSTKKTASDTNVHMTASSRFSLNQKLVKDVDASSRVIPTPYQALIPENSRQFNIVGISIENGHLLGRLQTGASDLLHKLGVSENGDHKVSFISSVLTAEVSGPESYSMEITLEGTTITGESASGLFLGLMSFIGLLDIRNGGRITLKEAVIYDKPRFEYRGHQVRSN